MRAIGAHQGLSPVLDVCRDPRWGRFEETFGEDPYLVARMGVAFVRGLQGDDLARRGDRHRQALRRLRRVGGRDELGAGATSRRASCARSTSIPFEAAVRAAGLRSVMNGYHELDGVPCGADRGLLTGILRDEWGFDGVRGLRLLLGPPARRVPPAGGGRLTGRRGGAGGRARRRAARHRLLRRATAGCPGGGRHRREGRRRRRCGGCCATKFELGLFEQPFVDLDAVAAVTDTPQQRALARRVAQQVHGPAAQRRDPPAAIASRLGGGDRPQCRRGPAPLRRLHLPGARRVAAGDAERRTTSSRSRSRTGPSSATPRWEPRPCSSRCGSGSAPP